MPDYSIKWTIKDVEKDLIKERMSLFEGNKERVAKSLGIARATLYRKLQEYGISRKHGRI